jgi:hypothetical protein
MRLKLWILASLLPSALVAATPTAPAQRPFLRGMTVSCPMYGAVWGSRAMTETLDELQELGVEWVAIHPYSEVRRDGSIRIRRRAADTGYLPSAVQRARHAGIDLFWKPHLAYWGSFEWRGAIEFGNDQTAWRRFFDGYREFILDQARFAEASGLSLFAVGVELEATTHFEPEWRRIIADVRRVYSGRITYAANWDSLSKVPFWDALDLIGVQAYFPLSEATDPDRASLEKGWERHLKSLREISERHAKPVLFTEIGYDLSASAAREPWLTASRDNARNRALRSLLITTALEQVERQPFIAGMFWWKWIPGRRGSDDFAMRDSQARELLRRSWARDD